jgi:hypothetical protein
MLPALSARFRPFVWFLIVSFVISSTPHIELVIPYAGRLIASEAHAAEASQTEADHMAESAASDTAKQAASDKKEEGAQTMASGSGVGSGALESGDNSPGGASPSIEASLFTGAAAVSIPIVTPPGRLGIAPNLAIKYNSFQGNGQIGVGFSLDMGSIQRSTKNGVAYGPNDNDYIATINGASVELVPRGTNIYGPRIDQNAMKFEKIGDRWEVTTLDGTKYYYGSAEASRQLNWHAAPYGIFKWYLDKVQDPHGNTMKVFYTKDTSDSPHPNNEVYLDRIEYTSNDGQALSATHQVSFVYEDRPDVIRMYNSGAPVVTKKRLKTISIGNVGLTTVHTKYELAYIVIDGASVSKTTKRSLLQSVTRYDGANNTLPSTVFTWRGSEALTLTLPAQELKMSLPWTQPEKWRIGDANGDGKTDFMGVHAKFVTGLGNRLEFLTALSNGDGTYAAATQWVEPGGSGVPDSCSWNVSRRWFAGDVDGDGKADFMGVRPKPNNLNKTYVLTALSNGDGTYRCSELEINARWTLTQWFTGDTDGDGKTEIMGVLYLSTTSLLVAKPELDQNGLLMTNVITTTYSTNQALPSAGRWFSGDVNGDGKSDFMGALCLPDELGFCNQTMLVTAAIKNSSIDRFVQYTTPISWGTQWFSGDVNGDGKADFMGVYTDPTSYNVFFRNFMTITPDGNGSDSEPLFRYTELWQRLPAVVPRGCERRRQNRLHDDPPHRRPCPGLRGCLQGGRPLHQP